MASPKRKTKSTAKNARAHATRSAYKPSARPAAKESASAAWTKPAAQLYQMPFNADEMQEVTKKAAANATELWKNMWNPEQAKEQWSSMMANMPKMPGMKQAVSEGGFVNFGSGTAVADQLTRSAASAAEAVQEVTELSRENVETLTQAGNKLVETSKELGAELISYTNRSFAQNVELSKQVLSCRTLNDMFDLSGRMFKNNLDNYFTETVRLSEKLFEAMTEVTEPLNERFSETASRMTKAMAS